VHQSKDYEYATVRTPKRVDGKKVNDPVYLGRVINLKDDRFRSKTTGEFFFSREKGALILQRLLKIQLESPKLGDGCFLVTLIAFTFRLKGQVS
jgi:hypothetical protein